MGLQSHQSHAVFLEQTFESRLHESVVLQTVFAVLEAVGLETLSSGGHILQPSLLREECLLQYRTNILLSVRCGREHCFDSVWFHGTGLDDTRGNDHDIIVFHPEHRRTCLFGRRESLPQASSVKICFYRQGNLMSSHFLDNQVSRCRLGLQSHQCKLGALQDCFKFGLHILLVVASHTFCVDEHV